MGMAKRGERTGRVLSIRAGDWTFESERDYPWWIVITSRNSIP